MKKILIKIIKLYQKIPGDFHNHCNFTPTCSNYAIEAINEYGCIKGTYLSIKRIIRCNPFGKVGYDPVPKKKEKIMKKVVCIMLSLLTCLASTGCFKSDTMEGIDIYTTVYPIEYIVDRLYGENSNIDSIYPDGTVPTKYELTSKQIKDYSKAELFIFNGLVDEKNYVTEFFKHNKNIKIIDSTQSMEINNRTEELWLNPSNLLMIAQNIKNGLNEYITNHYLKENIEENYNNLKLELSNLDAEINLVSNNASRKTIIVTDDLFLFLSKYGFNIISLDIDTTTEKTIADATKLIKDGAVTTIFAPNGEELSEVVNLIVDDTDVKVSYLHTLSTITNQERKNKKDYLSIMKDNLELLKEEIYK